jgi:hypothetical protein
MNVDPDDNPSAPKGHLVYSAKGDKASGVARVLIIHISGTITKNHFCDVYIFDQTKGCIYPRAQVYSRPYMMLEEHGWFKDTKLFADICKSEYGKDQLDYEAAVLARITEDYGELWTPSHIRQI